MTRDQLINKLMSRKFFALVSGLAVSLCILFRTSDSTTAAVTSAITSLGTIAAYLYVEGTIDMARNSSGNDTTTKPNE